MVLCQYFLAGNCRFGTKCFNDHIDLKQIIRVEIDSAIKGNQWPLSCFGPFKDKPCIPNFIEDQSFEEVRYKFYEAKASGNFEQVRQGFINLIQESKSKLQQLNMLSPEIMNIFVQLYDAGSDPKVNPVGQTAPIAANPFAAASISNSQVANQAQSIFGKSTFTTAPDQSAASIFGGTPPNQQQTSNIFATGSFAAPNQSPGIFGGGQTVQQPSQSIFGASTQPNPSVFGQPINPFQGASAGSQFALPQIGTQQPTQSVFGPPQPAQGIFGAPTQPQPVTNSIFGSQTTFQQPNQPIQSVFAAPANQSPFVGGQHGIFGQQQQPQQPTAANIFQNQQQQPQQTSIFAQAPQPDSNVAQMSTNVFNQLPQQPASVFGQHQNSAQSSFQQPLPHLQQQQSPSIQSSPFAPAQQQQQVQVQQPQVQQVQVQTVQNPPAPTNGYYDLCYSKLADLTPEELEAFKSDQFEVGQIPTVPPPKELCF